MTTLKTYYYSVKAGRNVIMVYADSETQALYLFAQIHKVKLVASDISTIRPK